MAFEDVDSSVLIATHPLHDFCGFLVPEENVAAIAATDDEFRAGSEEIDVFDGLGVQVAFVAFFEFSFVVVTIEEENVFVGITGDNFAAVVVVHGCGDT